MSSLSPSFACCEQPGQEPAALLVLGLSLPPEPRGSGSAERLGEGGHCEHMQLLNNFNTFFK